MGRNPAPPPSHMVLRKGSVVLTFHGLLIKIKLDLYLQWLRSKGGFKKSKSRSEKFSEMIIFTFDKYYNVITFF